MTWVGSAGTVLSFSGCLRDNILACPQLRSWVVRTSSQSDCWYNFLFFSVTPWSHLFFQQQCKICIACCKKTHRTCCYSSKDTWQKPKGEHECNIESHSDPTEVGVIILLTGGEIEAQRSTATRPWLQTQQRRAGTEPRSTSILFQSILLQQGGTRNSGGGPKKAC